MEALHQSVPDSSSGVTPLRLLPRVAENIGDTLADRALIHDLVDGFGSPLNLVFPDNIAGNLESFKQAYRKHMLRGKIYFTSKPCKSKALVRKASTLDVGVDVSSAQSLDHVLSGGFSPDRIEATGPKNDDYIFKCLQLDVLLNADSMSELLRIAAFHKRLGLTRKARVMVRLTGFSSPRLHFTPQDGTFGTHIKDIPAIIDWLAAHQQIFDFKGFSFHVNDVNQQQKLVAIENALELTFLAIKRGLKPKGIDIGGGFAIQYARDPAAYAAYVEHLKKSVIGKAPRQIWNGGGLGFKDHNGVVGGAPMFMDHVPAHTRGEELDYVLGQRAAAFGNATYADMIRDSLLELYIEPGRALLDQCGVTLARVAFVKKSAWGENLVGLEMNRSNIHSLNIKNLCEPIVIPRDPVRNKRNEEGFYLVGNLCLAYDILQYNKVYPDVMPEEGDVIAFTNTAPYMMDFTESETLMHPVAEKVVVWNDGVRARWARDNQYQPIEIDGETT